MSSKETLLELRSIVSTLSFPSSSVNFLADTLYSTREHNMPSDESVLQKASEPFSLMMDVVCHGQKRWAFRLSDKLSLQDLSPYTNGRRRSAV